MHLATNSLHVTVFIGENPIVSKQQVELCCNDPETIIIILSWYHHGYSVPKLIECVLCDTLHARRIILHFIA